MQLVISIVSWNTRDLLRACLSSLQRFCRPNHTRIIVIDNASGDGTPEMLRKEFPHVGLIESGGNLGFGRAHNLIADHSDEPFILFLNPDTEFVEAAHEAMLAALTSDPHVGMVGCRMTNLDDSTQPLGFQTITTPSTELITGLFVSRLTLPIARRLFPYHDELSDGHVRKLYGGCLMVRRSVLNEVGWFDERFFMYGEDVDLSRRVESAGHRLYYLSSARVIHLCGGASAQAPGRFATLMQCESISKLMEKYYGRFGRFRYVLAVLCRSTVRLGILASGRVVAPLLGPRRRVLVDKAWAKNLAILRWSLGLDKAVIPSK